MKTFAFAPHFFYVCTTKLNERIATERNNGWEKKKNMLVAGASEN